MIIICMPRLLGEPCDPSSLTAHYRRAGSHAGNHHHHHHLNHHHDIDDHRHHLHDVQGKRPQVWISSRRAQPSMSWWGHFLCSMSYVLWKPEVFAYGSLNPSKSIISRWLQVSTWWWWWSWWRRTTRWRSAPGGRQGRGSRRKEGKRRWKNMFMFVIIITILIIIIILIITILIIIIIKILILIIIISWYWIYYWFVPPSSGKTRTEINEPTELLSHWWPSIVFWGFPCIT